MLYKQSFRPAKELIFLELIQEEIAARGISSWDHSFCEFLSILIMDKDILVYRS